MSAGRVLAFLVFALLAACATPVGTDYTAMSVALPPLKPGEGRVFLYTPGVRFGGDVGRASGSTGPWSVSPCRAGTSTSTVRPGATRRPARRRPTAGSNSRSRRRNEVRAHVRPVGLLGQRGPLPAGARDRRASGHGRARLFGDRGAVGPRSSTPALEIIGRAGASARAAAWAASTVSASGGARTSGPGSVVSRRLRQPQAGEVPARAHGPGGCAA